MEEAIVHRKRSSRIAIKESEKEQAVVAAKKKAEEDEKSARARRQEMRAKKEEQERAKREKAREQRRIEREEREKRAREKEERAERRYVVHTILLTGMLSRVFIRAKGEEDRHSTMTPVLAGTHSTESIQLSSAPTPTGVQTPNWVLDCEICHKNGINIVSCNVSLLTIAYHAATRMMARQWSHVESVNGGSTSSAMILLTSVRDGQGVIGRFNSSIVTAAACNTPMAPMAP